MWWSPFAFLAVIFAEVNDHGSFKVSEWFLLSHYLLTWTKTVRNETKYENLHTTYLLQTKIGIKVFRTGGQRTRLVGSPETQGVFLWVYEKLQKRHFSSLWKLFASRSSSAKTTILFDGAMSAKIQWFFLSCKEISDLFSVEKIWQSWQCQPSVYEENDQS